jgi:transcriptional regulator with XRE-family HTH domain
VTENISGNSKKIKAAVMLSSGMSQLEVAKKLNVTPRTIQRWQKEEGFDALKHNVACEVLGTTIKATAEHLSEGANPVFSYKEKKNLILKECEHLDYATSVVLPLIGEGNIRAIDCLIRISQRRSQLLALDQPRSTIIDAVATLAQHGVIRRTQYNSVNEIFDEADLKLTQLGLD